MVLLRQQNSEENVASCKPGLGFGKVVVKKGVEILIANITAEKGLDNITE